MPLRTLYNDEREVVNPVNTGIKKMAAIVQRADIYL